MSAVISLNVLKNRNVDEANAWLAKAHAANLRNYDKFQATGKDPDTVLAGPYIEFADKATQEVLISQECRQMLKFECNRIRDKEGNSYCHVFTYAHWRVQQKFGADYAGRLTDDQEANEYSRRGVSRNPEIRDYFQQVVREVVERAKAMA